MPLVLEGFELRLKTSEEFLNADFRQHFLIRRVLVQGQHCVLGGPKKVLKTSLLVDLALSLATGTPWLGNPDFAVPDAVPVMLLSGESGGYTLRETARRIALAKNQLLSSAKVFWGFDLPQLGNAEHLGVLEVEIKRLGIKVAIIDPAYLCLLSAGASANITSNVFAMGALLKNISDIGTRTGCTMIICHHTRKADRQSSPFGVPDLEDLSGSGFAEWARQWVLLNRREAYQGDGKHSLWMTGGGSAGHSGTYAFDVAEGVISEDGDGRTWDVSVSKATEAVQRSKAEKETAKEQKAREAILAAYALFPDGETGRTIREAAGISGVKFGSINAVLIAAGIVEHCQITKNKRDEAAFRLVPP
ncbi:MAG: AAA family ATPase [Planctomycetaceae bacterium]